VDADTEVMCFVATARPDAALAFYRDILGLRLTEDSPFALVFETGERMLRVQKVAQVAPVPNTVLGWKVADIHREIRELEGKGVAFTRFDGLLQDEGGVWTSPAGHKIAWFRDPDGNNLSLTQFDE
jgi:catechol 2,3-dioxygenase-like lactoylglutathione lyase family enzyme